MSLLGYEYCSCNRADSFISKSGGLYDRGKDLNWKQIKDYDVMGAMGKAGGGRNEVTAPTIP